MSWFRQLNLFRPSGELGRSGFLVFLALHWALILYGAVALDSSVFYDYEVQGGADFAALGLGLAATVILVLASIKRFHDIGMSGFWTIGMVLPFVGGLLGLILLLRPGTEPLREGPAVGELSD